MTREKGIAARESGSRLEQAKGAARSCGCADIEIWQESRPESQTRSSETFPIIDPWYYRCTHSETLQISASGALHDWMRKMRSYSVTTSSS
jgi:hypothetical protein